MERLAFPPGKKSTGHYSRHLDTVLNTGSTGADQYQVAVPRFLAHSAAREVRPMPAVPPHECLHEESLAKPGLAPTLRRSTAQRRAPSTSLARLLQNHERDTGVFVQTLSGPGGGTWLRAILAHTTTCASPVKGIRKAAGMVPGNYCYLLRQREPSWRARTHP